MNREYTRHLLGEDIQIDEAVRVDTDAYQGSWGHAPRGMGNWLFDIDGEQFAFTGKYMIAKKEAVGVAKKKKAKSIKVMP